jgi:hypothetical protein
MEIGLEIVTDRRVALKFDRFPQQAHDQLLKAITGSTDRLRSLVDAAVPKRTGRLESEITDRVVDAPNHITGYVGVTGGAANDFAKAAALEYGAHGTAHLREHAARLGHLWSKLIDPMKVIVSAHDRRLNITAHDFLRGPLRQIQESAVVEMKDALAEAANE